MKKQLHALLNKINIQNDLHQKVSDYVLKNFNKYESMDLDEFKTIININDFNLFYVSIKEISQKFSNLVKNIKQLREEFNIENNLMIKIVDSVIENRPLDLNSKNAISEDKLKIITEKIQSIEYLYNCSICRNLFYVARIGNIPSSSYCLYGAYKIFSTF